MFSIVEKVDCLSAVGLRVIYLAFVLHLLDDFGCAGRLEASMVSLMVSLSSSTGSSSLLAVVDNAGLIGSSVCVNSGFIVVGAGSVNPCGGGAIVVGAGSINPCGGGAGKGSVGFLKTVSKTKSGLFEGVGLVTEACYGNSCRPVINDVFEAVTVVGCTLLVVPLSLAVDFIDCGFRCKPYTLQYGVLWVDFQLYSQRETVSHSFLFLDLHIAVIDYCFKDGADQHVGLCFIAIGKWCIQVSSVINVPLYHETQHELAAITTCYSSDSYSCILKSVSISFLRVSPMVVPLYDFEVATPAV
ncbi:hypothetical protein Tco_1563676 [Tanacetum coccineum]